jgi:ABC-type multidrug transport system ATPase subunit
VTQSNPPTPSSASSAPLIDQAPPPQRHEVAALSPDHVIRIGRHRDNEVVLTDLQVSQHHAEIRPTAAGYQIVDLGSTNGIHHNGRRVRLATLKPGDRVSVGHHDFIFDGRQLHQFLDAGPTSLFADDLTVQVKKQTLLDDVSFAVQQGSLVAVIGPSGCGKSTLIRAVTGLRPADQGTVTYDGRDLYKEFDELRYRIGLVPQDDVLHRQLTVRRALRFSAALRFADDVPRRERSARVEEVIDLLGLKDRAKQRIDTLSGGQRKRTSVALELLTEPSLLCLDEPTSGLDPALDREVMRELRELADRGRTVVVVTHSVLNLELCDRILVLCQGGRMGFFGPPEEVLNFFGANDYADVFEMITNDAAAWAVRYRNSEVYRTHVGEVILRLTATPPNAIPAAQPGPQSADGDAWPGTAGGVGTATPLPPAQLKVRRIRPAAPLRQFITLAARMFTVIFSDRGYAAFLVGLPLVLALLTHSVPGNHGLALELFNFTLEAQRLLVVLVVGAAFLGIAVAIREIVSESTIYARERAVGISPGAYLASKLFVFLVIDVLQVIVFVYLSLLGRPGPTSPLIFSQHGLIEIMVPVALVAFVCTCFGLLISTLVRTVEQTTPILVVSVMAFLVLSGGLFELHGQKVLEQVSWLAPTRWGFAAGASTVDLQKMLPADYSDPLWGHTIGAWWRSIVLLVVQAAAFIAATRWALTRHDPGKK